MSPLLRRRQRHFPLRPILERQPPLLLSVLKEWLLVLLPRGRNPFLRSPMGRTPTAISVLSQGDFSVQSHAQNYTDEVAPSKKNRSFTLPHEENRNGDFHTLGREGVSTISHEANHSGDATPFGENGHPILPYENCDGDVHALELGSLSAPSHEESLRPCYSIRGERLLCALPDELQRQYSDFGMERCSSRGGP